MALLAKPTPPARYLAVGVPGGGEKVKATPCPFPLSKAAVRWLASGDRDPGSDAIFERMTGIRCGERWHFNYPRDPSELGRCRKLLKAVPEFAENFRCMRTVSWMWATLVDHWAELCALMDEDARTWRHGRGSLPRTLKRMQDLGC